MNVFGFKVDGAMYYWIYGFFYAIVTVESGYAELEYTATYTGMEFDPFGLICMMIIITGAIVSLVLGIATEEKVAAIGGVIGLTGIIVFYLGVLTALNITPTHEIVQAGYYPIPFVGFFVCVIGGIVALFSIFHLPRTLHVTLFTEIRRVLLPSAPLLFTCHPSSWEGFEPDWMGANEMFWSNFSHKWYLQTLE